MDEKFSGKDAAYILAALVGIALAVASFLGGRWAVGVVWLLIFSINGLTLVSRHAEALGVSHLRSRFHFSTAQRIAFYSTAVAVFGVVLFFAVGWPLFVVALVGLGAIEVWDLVSVFRRARSSGGPGT